MTLSRPEKDKLFQLGIKAKIDCRLTACNVKVTHVPWKGVLFEGYVQYSQMDAFLKTMAKEIYELPQTQKKTEGGAVLNFQVKVLDRLAPRFAVVTKTACRVWRNPDATNLETLDTEALYGCVVRTYHTEGDFTLVQVPDGYIGFAPTADLEPVSIQDYLRWKNGKYALTLVPLKADDQVIPVGSRLLYSPGKLHLPDGSTLKVLKSQVVVFDPTSDKLAKTLQDRAAAVMDTPYLWGGKTEIGIDCSGFVQTLFAQEGILLPRDASMQCHMGEIVGYLPDYKDLLPGDVIFFMNKNAYIFHVGIYLGDHKYMHSAGKSGPTISSVYPEGENFIKRYGSAFVYARRMRS